MRIRFLVLSLGLTLLLGCAAPPSDAPQAPLGTSSTVAPPPGCVELRKRGGSC